MRIIKGLGAMTAALLACAVMTGCNSDGEPEATPRADIQLTPAQKVISQSNVEFAIDLLKASNSADKNVLVAPFSASAVLSMLANGSGEATSSEIIAALHLDASEANEINEYYKKVTTGLLNADNRTKLTFANAVWVDGSMKPSSDFKNACNGYYKANMGTADFKGNHTKALQDINAWVSKATNGEISAIFDPQDISSQTRFCVVNSGTFDGKWKYTFDEKATKPGNFTNYMNRTENIMMMRSEGQMPVSIGENADLIEVPYGNGAFVMDVIVPKPEININDYVSNQLATDYESLLSSAKASTCVLYLPRFSAKLTNEMIKALRKLGIKNAFTDNADFRPMFDESSAFAAKDLSLSTFKQKINIEVNEQGTKVVVVTGSSGRDGKVVDKDFIVDTPFVYVIREVSTGTILFIGKAQSLKDMQ